jgi:hypothetical protein
MRAWVDRPIIPFLSACLLITLLACSPEPPDSTPPQDVESQPAVTPTAAPEEESDPMATPTNTPAPSPPPERKATLPAPEFCQGVAGELEVQVVVGPAEAVGLEPVAVGSVPFSVSGGAPPNLVSGGGNITYLEVLEEEWGTYVVNLDMSLVLSGDCVEMEGLEQLNLSLTMTGEQNVEVTAEGFHGEYPWSGTQQMDFVLPVVDGASYEGEGFAFVLWTG